MKAESDIAAGPASIIARRGPRYAAAAAAVAAAFLLRMALQPWLGENHAYGAFYPAVFLVAYVLGRPPAYFAAALAAVAGLWAFLQPAYGWSLRPEALAPLVFFVITAGAGIWLITALTAGLDTLAREQGRARAIADAHAELFKTLQSRTGYHMQLISSVLALQPRGELDQQMLELLRTAGDRAKVIARAHREFSGAPEEDVDFLEFARAIGRAVCLETQQAETCVEFEGETVQLPADTATSLGIALVECLVRILKRKPPGVARVRLGRHDATVTLAVSHTSEGAGELIALAPEAELFGAMIGQIGGAVRAGMSPEGIPAIEISLPIRPGPASVVPPGGSMSATLH